MRDKFSREKQGIHPYKGGTGTRPPEWRIGILETEINGVTFIKVSY